MESSCFGGCLIAIISGAMGFAYGHLQTRERVPPSPLQDMERCQDAERRQLEPMSPPTAKSRRGSLGLGRGMTFKPTEHTALQMSPRTPKVTVEQMVTDSDPLCRRSWASSSTQKKVIYLVRHAEAEHNVQELALMAQARREGKDQQEAEKLSKAVLKEESFRDANLSGHGVDQVKQSLTNFEILLKDTHFPQPETVLVSPLQRTCRTATVLFPGHKDMRAVEFLRERRTGFPCDERKAAWETKADFPHIEFSDVEEADKSSTDGYVFRPELREVAVDVAARGQELLPLIKELPADVVAVTSHKGFIRELLQCTWREFLVCEEKLSATFKNAEVRVCEVEWNDDGEPRVTAMSLKQAILAPTVHVGSIDLEPSQTTRGRTKSMHTQDHCFRVVVGSSDLKEPSAAVQEALGQIKAQLGQPPSVALVYGHCSLDAVSVINTIRHEQPSMSVIGASSMRGVVTASDATRLGIVGFDRLAKRCSIGHVKGCDITDRTDPSSYFEAGVNATWEATLGSCPDMIILHTSPGHEEHVLDGIERVCPGVRIFGATAGNESMIDETCRDQPWQVYGGLVGWGVSEGGVLLMALWLHDHVSAHCALSHCYGPTLHHGVITSAEGRSILEIDGLPAAKRLREWTGLQLEPGRLAAGASAFPLALKSAMGEREWQYLASMHKVGFNHEVDCFTRVDDGRAEVTVLNAKPKDLVGAVTQVAQTAKQHVRFNVQFALVVICAGTASLLSEEDFALLRKKTTEIAPQCLILFSYGEQGSVVGNNVSVHGNNMLNFVFFGHK